MIIKSAQEFRHKRIVNDIRYVINLISDEKVLSMKPWYKNKLIGLIIHTNKNTYHIHTQSIVEIAKYYNCYTKDFEDELYVDRCIIF